MADIQNERNQIIQLQTYLDEKNYSAALTLAEQTLKQFPFSFQTKLYYAKILKALGRHPESIQFLSDLDKQFPYNIGILSELAATHYYMQQFQESLIFYNRILFLDSFNDQAKQRVEEIQRLLNNRFHEKLDETQVDEKSSNRKRSEMEIARQPTRVIPDDEIASAQGNPQRKLTEIVAPAEPRPPKLSPDEKTREKTVRGEGVEDIPFITESAAELYAKQGLFEQARHIYRRLFDQTGDIRFQEKLQKLPVDAGAGSQERIVDSLERLLKKFKAGDSNHVQ